MSHFAISPTSQLICAHNMQARKLVRNVADALVNPASKILRGSVGMLGLPVPIDLYRGYDD